MSDYICDYCLELAFCVRGDIRESEPCPHCKTGVCQSCGTRLKPGAELCYGCGVENPDIRVRVFKSSSTGGVYVERNWQKAGLGRGCEFIYGISLGWETVEDMNAHKPAEKWVYRERFDGSGRENVRQLPLLKKENEP